MLDSLGAIKELYEASKGGEVLAAINHAAKMTTSTLPFTGFSRSQIRSIPTRYDVCVANFCELLRLINQITGRNVPPGVVTEVLRGM